MLAVENHWVQTNIIERQKNPNLDFDAWFKKTPFKAMSFDESTIYSAIEIKKNYGDVILAFSGGYDSRYTLMKLIEAGCKVTPVIIIIKWNICNIMETKFAFDDCKKYGLVPIVIEMTEKEHLKLYFEKIMKPINSAGVFNLPCVLAGEIALRQNKKLITGEHFLGYLTGYGSMFNMCDYDVCAEPLGEELLCPFFCYSPAVLYAMLKELPFNPTLNEYQIKNIMYKLPDQPCIDNLYFDPEVRDMQWTIIQGRKHKPQTVKFLGTREKLITLLDGWKI